MAYPWIAMKVNEKNSSKVIDGYEKKLKDYSKEKKKQMLQEAANYNQKIADSNVIMTDPFDEEAQRVTIKEYDQKLNIDGSGMMGYLDIDKIDVHLPICHRVSQKVLEKNVGHLPETSLPVEGKSVHCVLSAHTGMSEARLFSDLDKMETGDYFQICVLDTKLTYRVFKTEIVKPEEITSLGVEKGKNQCTLVTCTPYGINTHRLLVHGTQVKKMGKSEEKVNKKWNHKIIRIIAILCIIAGAITCVYPYLCRQIQKNTTGKRIDEFELIAENENLRYLRREMEAYNKRIYLEGQSGLKDAWSYQTSSFRLKDWGVDCDVAGYLEIPSIKICLPIYLGANKENMKKGVAHLSQTSLPIGGENTNCVIAGHRGYAKAEMFRNLDRLKAKDEIYITNFWETRCYEVWEKKVILPDDTDKILIQDGKDLLTLITCHPYRHNYQRLVVYCKCKDKGRDDQYK